MSIIDQLRSVRIFHIALFDVLSSLIIVGYLLRRNHPDLPTIRWLVYTIIITFLLAVCIHYVFGIQTRIQVF